MMDSMTDPELDCVVPMSDDRVTRVARGAGVPELQVRILMQTCKQFEKMLGKLGKTGLLKNDGAMAQQMSRDPAKAMQSLAGSMDPRMLQQMGGMENIQKMMKGMMGGGGGGGMGGMEEQMKQMMAGMGGGGGGMPGGGGGRRGGGRRGRR